MNQYDKIIITGTAITIILLCLFIAIAEIYKPKATTLQEAFKEEPMVSFLLIIFAIIINFTMLVTGIYYIEKSRKEKKQQ